jgi:hypothetical protein
MSTFFDKTFHMNQLGRYKIVLTAEQIARFINYCEDTDDTFFMEFEQILKNALETPEPCTLPLEKQK